uniref:C2H2-type domain-containing protein n=1 Tax=Panagrolaimus sp. ES5 TaxID=591445 RepID=A0AC34G2W5_9BILA
MFNYSTTPSSSTSTSTTLFDEVRTALLRNATNTLTSEAHALLQHTFAKDWDQPLSISPFNDATISSNFLSPKFLLPTNTVSPTTATTIFGEQQQSVDLDFGENTLDWKLSISDAAANEEEADDELNEGINKATVLTCIQCGFIAKNRKQLWRHGKRENHITRSTLIKSETCSKKYANKEANEHQCDLCKYSSKSRFNVLRHFQRVHINQKWHGKRENHITRSTLIKAEACSKKYANKEASEHQCDLCKYSSKSRFNVLRHFQRVHINQKCTSCDQCDKQFKDLDTLKTHIRYTHNNERKFLCDVCKKQFVSSSDLQRHRKIVHEKIRDYFCQKCGKNFQTQSNAKRHFLEVCSSSSSVNSKIVQLNVNPNNSEIVETVFIPEYTVASCKIE